MSKKQIPDTPKPCSVFKVGDLVSNQFEIMKVVLKVLNSEYEFIRLKDEYIETSAGRVHLKKGDIATQPFYVFDKYHYLYQP